MKRIVLLVSVLLVFIKAFSQHNAQRNHPGAYKKLFTGSNNQPASTGNSGTGDNMDMLYHRINWSVDPNSNSQIITGSVTTLFKTLNDNVTDISFDLNAASFNNSSLVIKYHGVECAYSFPSTGNTNVLNIFLPAAISSANTIDSLTINYAGMPPQDGSGEGFPFLQYTDQSGQVQHYIVTISESYEDRDWWPCKADMQDKIDSMDIHVTVPWSGADTFWVASNGLLVDSSINGNERTFSYRSRYPIASYLVCLGIAKYRRYYSSVPLGNENVPVYWYLLAGRSAAYYSNAVAAMTKMNGVVQAYSKKIGDYPFKKEKHGYYDGLIGAGGMEHQTFSAISSGSLTSTATLDHELMHQWFGDNVTPATWNDLWLAEGFASYGEVLAAELVPSLGYGSYARRNAFKNDALSYINTSAWIPNSNIVNSSTIWNSNYGGAVYDRGCMVVSMLRAICGDAKFFEALKAFQHNLAGKAANTDSLKQYFNSVLGTDLSEFFNDYVGGSGNAATAVGGKGNPVYQIKWNIPEANKLLLGVLTQTKTTGSNVEYFNGPVVIRAVGNQPGQDTSICFFDWGNGDLSHAGNGIGLPVSGNLLSYNLSFTPDALIYDDSAYTLTTGATILDTALKGFIWYGTADTDWFNPANWAECCGVPPANADISIATITHPPVLTTSIVTGNITINAGKFISLAGNTLTVNGMITGTGSLKGAANANLVINGKGSVVRFLQGTSTERQLQSLTLNEGSSASLQSNADIINLTVNPAAVLMIAANANIVTH